MPTDGEEQERRKSRCLVHREKKERENKCEEKGRLVCILYFLSVNRGNK